MTRKLLRGLLFLFVFTAAINATDLRPVLLLTPSAEISPPLDTNFDVEVENENVLMANSFIVRFTLLDPDGNTVFTEDVQGMNLPPFSKDTYATTGTYNFTETGVYTLVVNVIFSDEIDPSDNEKEYTITVTETCPGPPANFSPANGAELNLSASNNGGFGNSVELSWQNPGNQTDVKVFFGTDEAAVGSASDELLLTGGASLSSTNVEPDFFGQTYYWMVQEICVQGEETFTNNGPVNSFVMVNTPIFEFPEPGSELVIKDSGGTSFEWNNPPGQTNVDVFGSPSSDNLFEPSNMIGGGSDLNTVTVEEVEPGLFFIGFESTFGDIKVQSEPFEFTFIELCGQPPVPVSPPPGTLVDLTPEVFDPTFQSSLTFTWTNPDDVVMVELYGGFNEELVENEDPSTLLGSGGSDFASQEVQFQQYSNFYWKIKSDCGSGTSASSFNLSLPAHSSFPDFDKIEDIRIIRRNDGTATLPVANPPGQDNVGIFVSDNSDNLFSGNNLVGSGSNPAEVTLPDIEPGPIFVGFENTFGDSSLQSRIFELNVVNECGAAVIDSPDTDVVLPFDNTNKVNLGWTNPPNAFGNLVLLDTDSNGVKNMSDDAVVHENGVINELEVILMPNTDYYWAVGVDCGEGLLMGDLNTFTTGDLPGTMLEPGDGIEFSQVDYTFPLAPAENSNTGMVAVDNNQVAEASETPLGYLNIFGNNGWVIQNMIFDPTSGYEGFSTFFPLSTPMGADVQQFNALVIASDVPITGQKDFGPVTTFEVKGTVYNAEGRNNAITSFPAPVEPVAIPFDTNKTTEFVWQKGHVNIEQSTNQCGPASVANSLQWLENEQNIEVPHEHTKGYRDSTLVGQLDSAAQRTNHNTVGDVNMLKGKIKYVDDNDLSDDLVLKHKNRKGAAFVANDTVKQGDYYSVANTDTTSLIDWIIQELKDGEDVELAIGWDGGGGHWVDLIGGGYVKGVPWIAWVHDTDQGHNDMGTASTADDTTKVNGGIDFKSGGFSFSYIVNNKLASVAGGDTSIGTIDLAFSESKKEVTSVSEEYTRGLKTEYALSQNYPNPFNPSTTIEYSIQNSGYVRLTIFDILGKEVDVLVDGFKQVGSYKLTYDASKLTSGVYFYTLQVDNTYITKKFVLLK